MFIFLAMFLTAPWAVRGRGSGGAVTSDATPGHVPDCPGGQQKGGQSGTLALRTLYLRRGGTVKICIISLTSPKWLINPKHEWISYMNIMALFVHVM